MFAILSFMILNHNKIIIKQNYTSSDKKGNKTGTSEQTMKWVEVCQKKPGYVHFIDEENIISYIIENHRRNNAVFN